VQALAGVDLDVAAGSICAVLGRNGAGKTTAVRILTTLLAPHAGRAEVAGFDVVRDAARVRARIGVTGQNATVDSMLTGRENLELVGRMFHLPRAVARERAAALLERFGLQDAAERRADGYSGGMRRRLDLASSLIAEPIVLFLDEPTTGLDPVARAGVWRAIRELVDAGTTVLLTTQYLEEADQLADTIALIDRGVVSARGTPAQLRAQVGRARVRVTLPDADPGRVATVLDALGPRALPDGRTISVPAPDGLADLGAAVAQLRSRDVVVQDVALEHPTLDEAFAALTGAAAPAPQPAAADTAGAAGAAVAR